MRRAVVIVSLSMVAWGLAGLAARDACAQEAPAEAQVPHAEPAAKEPPAGGLVLRLGLAGVYHRLDGIPIYGGGLAFTLAGHTPIAAGLTLRAVGGRTEGGLFLIDANAAGTLEAQLGGGFRFHAGGGVYALSIQRATTGTASVCFGPSGLIGFGFDSGERDAFFAVVDLEAQLYNDGNAVWGPTLTLGYRF